MNSLLRLGLVVAGTAAGFGLLRHFSQRGAVVGGGSASPVPSPEDEDYGPTTGDWVNPNAPAEIRSIAARLEQIAHWPNLGNYLAAISYVESRGNNEAGSSGNNNKARGWFGLRPETAKTEHYGYADPNILKDKVTSVVLAADLADRLKPFASPGQYIDWLAIRRGWAYPKLVKDVDNSERPELVDRFVTGEKKVGLPKEFMHLPAFPEGQNWPGFHAALAAMQIA
jgi:hypothetical protein